MGRVFMKEQRTLNTFVKGELAVKSKMYSCVQDGWVCQNCGAFELTYLG